MTQDRKTTGEMAAPLISPALRSDSLGAEPSRPLSARSVIASMLLGTEGLSLPVRALVRAGELFGIAEGTTRVALSRMVASGELVTGPAPGNYSLAGGLLERSAAQEAGRRPKLQPWTGQWQMAVVTSSQPRPAPDRAALRRALRRLDLAEWREGVWLRPDNLGPPSRLPEAARVVSDPCQWLTCQLDGAEGGRDRTLAAWLWDLEDWADRARSLRTDMAEMKASVGDQLRPGFLLAATALRHLAADPLLPEELLPARWPGQALRHGYDRFEAALQSGLRRWFRSAS